MSSPLRQLQRLGWAWHDNGIIVTATIDGVPASVWIPMSHVVISFSRELEAVGCPLGCGIGAGAIGFWGSIKRAVKKVSRRVKKVLPKAVRRAVERVERKAGDVLRTAHRIGTSRTAQMIVVGMGAAFPVLAPAAAGIVAAQEALRHVEIGIRAAEAVQSGIRATPFLMRAMRKGDSAKAAIDTVLGRAAAGDEASQRFAGAIARIAA